MDIYVAKEKILPEPGEVKALMAQLDALLDVANSVKKKKPPVFADWHIVRIKGFATLRLILAS